jgi:hypothetical protein
MRKAVDAWQSNDRCFVPKSKMKINFVHISLAALDTQATDNRQS